MRVQTRIFDDLVQHSRVQFVKADKRRIVEAAQPKGARKQ